MISTTNLSQSPNIKHNTNPLPKGFTIIEVVLVLAIAGLIFLMVFIALPALQRNQRHTQRKNDVGRVLSAIQSYQTNNRGQLPAHPSTGNIVYAEDGETPSVNNRIINNYLNSGGEEFKHPDGRYYRLYFNNSGPVINGTLTADPYRSDEEFRVLTRRTIYITYSKRCGTPANTVIAADGQLMFTVQIALEGGG